MSIFSRLKKSKTQPKAQKKASKAKSAKASKPAPKATKSDAKAKGKEKGKKAKVALAPKAQAKAHASATIPAAGPIPVPSKEPREKGAAVPSPKPPKKSGRRSSLAMRRGPNGEPFQPGDLLLPSGAGDLDEVQYMLRGCVAAEHPVVETGVGEIMAKPGGQALGFGSTDTLRFAEGLADRFHKGPIEPLLPLRQPPRRNFAGVVERARHRRREIGAFLRGLDIGRTESSHMDAHAEASLQNLMEWAARLEMLTEADEPNNVDYTKFHRVLDQLDSTTEALIIDVEQTLRRLRDKVRG